MITKPKVVFWGSPEFSLPSLKACEDAAEIVAVVTQPDKERGRGHEVLPTPVKAYALARGLPVFSPKSLRKPDEETERLLSFLSKREADFFVVVAYGNLLPDSVLALPRQVPVNIHASLLPRWRGAAPIQRALEAGDAETGVSLQRVVKALDAGDIYLEKKYTILTEDNAASLFEKLSHLGADLISDFLQKDFSKLSAIPQNPDQITLAPKIDKGEALWNKTWTSHEFHNRVRAFSTWPTVKIPFVDKDGKGLEVKVLETKLLDEPLGTATQWGVENGGACITAADGSVLQLCTLQIPGKGPTFALQVFSYLENNKFQLLA